MNNSNINIHTCGNATLIIEKDKKPVIATDPWLDCHKAYFGSWATTHKIPDFHMSLLEKCPFFWISHFHPDHLNLRSLLRKNYTNKLSILKQNCKRIKTCRAECNSFTSKKIYKYCQ